VYKRLSTSQVLVLALLLVLIIGTLLLKLPIATNRPISWIDAWFMTTSALTCTGLTTVDVGTTFTIFGQLVLLVLIQVGAIGIMTFASLFFIILGKKLSLKDRLILNFSLNQITVGNLSALVKRLLYYVIIIESVGVLIFFCYFQLSYPWQQALHLAIFQSICSFTNAGFSLWSDGLVRFATDPVVNITTTGMAIIGGLGFTVVFDVWKKRNFRHLTLHSKIMLTGSLALMVSGMILFIILEFFTNPNLQVYPWYERLWTSYFQSVTLRSTGFNTIDISTLQESTLFYMCLFMFVGAGSTSTGGGIKVTTFVIIVFAVLSFLKGRRQIHIFNRSIDTPTILKCLAVFFVTLTLVAIGVFLLALFEDAPFIVCLFEVISAAGTVGLSAGITDDLTTIGALIITLLMFIGKAGPLVILFSLSRREQQHHINYPKEDILIG
jgi:trk system potassium uptake protein TrkH